MFEKHSVGRGKYKTFNLQSEIDHVEGSYGPYIVNEVKRRIEKKMVGDEMISVANIIDMSHASLFYYRGLIEVAKKSPEIHLHFIRIRRDRIETAISMINDVKFHDSYFKHAFFTYTPFENTPNVLHKLDASTWNDMTIVEQVFWVSQLVAATMSMLTHNCCLLLSHVQFIDEVEARWVELLADNPSLNYTEIYWANRWPGSFETALESVATFAGVVRAPPKKVSNLKHHMDNTTSHNVLLVLEYAALDRAYQQRMGFAYIPG